MQTKSNVGLVLFLALAFASASALVGNNCTDGFCTLSGVYAQVNRGPATPKRDPIMEKESAHHLDVAWQYFKKKVDKSNPDAATRVNKAIADRLEEVIDTNPTFSKIDEVYYLLAEVYLRLNDKPKAVHYFGLVVKDGGDSKYLPESKKRLEELSDTSKKEGK